MTYRYLAAIAIISSSLAVQSSGYAATSYGSNDTSRQTILTALMGAGTGAISAEASGGKAGTGALVGAGTQLIGSVLMQLLSPSPSYSSGSWTTQPVYSVPNTDYYAPPSYTAAYPVQQTGYTQTPAYSTVPATPVYYTSAANNQAESGKEILKNGLMGAATGAIAAEASDGKAGTGALVGAGTQVIGSALLDVFLTPSQPAAYGYQTPSYYQSAASSVPTKKIIRKYDQQGKIISEEEFWV